MKLLLLGAGGHAKAVIEVVRATGVELVGLVAAEPAMQVSGVPVIGTDADLPRLRAEGIEAAFAAIGDNALRQRLVATLRGYGFALPSLLHPRAVISPSASLGEAVIAMPLAFAGAEASIADGVILNAGAIVEHDGWIGAAAHIAPGAVLAGNVTVGERALVGVGAAVRPGTRIGADATVGAGAIVVADVPEAARVAGNPARPLARGR